MTIRKKMMDVIGIGLATGVGLSALEAIPISDSVMKANALNAVGMVGNIGMAKIGLDMISELDKPFKSKEKRLL